MKNFSLANYIQNATKFRPFDIEESILLRILVFLTVTVGILAATYVTESPVYIASLGIGLSGLGSWISWKRRKARNWALKLVLAFLMLVALANFIADISQNIYDARIPLSYLLIWLQALHSFDLPKRKDLFYSLWVALILISVGATISRDASFGIFFISFMLLSLLSLLFANVSSQTTQKLPASLLAKLLVPVLGIPVLAALALFPLLPRYEGLKIRSLPMSFKIPALPGFNGEIKNRAYPEQEGQAANGPKTGNKQRNKFDPFSYYGFSTVLDLNYRGRLSQEIVMRVKSTKASYWRGMAFDRYTGQAWEMSHPYQLRRLSGYYMPIYVRETINLKKNITPREEVTQTFYIEKDQSNLIFAAPYVEFLYFPTDYILADIYGGLRSPIELVHGTVYSVISEIPVFDVQRLRQAPLRSELDPVDPLYLQLPKTLSPRVRELTRQLAAGMESPFDAVKAIESHLKNTYPYNLDIPEFPEHADTIDYFLFQQKAGYCEHFASALAIMARTLGIPTRLVTGYSAGDFNPITGYFEVRSEHAHAWVEVYFPHHGWVPFDPTPGYNAYLGHHNIYRENTNKQFASFLWNLMPQQWKTTLSQLAQQAVSWLMAAINLVFSGLNWFFHRSLIIFLILMGFLLAWYLWHRQHRSTESPAASGTEPAYRQDACKKEFVDAYQALLGELTQISGLEASQDKTAQETIQAILGVHENGLREPLENLTGLYYRMRYSSAPLTGEEQQRITGLTGALKAQISKIRAESKQHNLANVAHKALK